MKIYVVIHNVISVQRLIEFAKVVYSLTDNGILVATKVGGTAAQAGIPEVNKMAYKLGKGIIILPDLKDAVELIRPEKVYLVTPGSGQKVNYSELFKNIPTMLVFHGLDEKFSKVDTSFGEEISMDIAVGDIGAPQLAAVLLYCVRKLIN